MSVLVLSLVSIFALQGSASVSGAVSTSGVRVSHPQQAATGAAPGSAPRRAAGASREGREGGRERAGAPAATPASAPAAPGEIEAGKALFARSCAICHGQEAIGNRGPALRARGLTPKFVEGVVNEGRPGTMMPAFKAAFTPAQISQLARYIGSLQVEKSIWADLKGNPKAGEEVFSNPNHSHSCQQCHSFKGKGGHVGPELAAKLTGKSPRDIFQKIVVVPHRAADPAYPTMALTTTAGERIVGIRANKDPEQIEFFDTSSLPPTFRTFAKAEVASLTKINASAMPDDYASRLSLQQLLDLVAFLKTNVDGVAVAPTLEDVVKPAGN